MPSRRPARTLAAVALALSPVAGCAAAPAESAAPAAETRMFVADNGEVAVPTRPHRVVATGYAVPVLIEAGAPLVGISSWDRGVPLMTDEDRAVYDATPRIAGATAAETDYEAIAAAEPDLIVIGVPAPALVDIDLERLASLAPVVAVGPTVPSGWREQSRLQSDAAGRLAEFDAVRERYEARAAELGEQYADTLDGLRFGHLGGYGQVAPGTFHREFSGSWGTNIAEDLGVTYPGAVAEPRGGGLDVSEYPALEQLGESFADADVITYTLNPDGSVPAPVQAVLDSPLWSTLPAVQAGDVFGLRYTEAATYTSALRSLEATAEALAPLRTR